MIDITREECFRLCKERAIADIIKWTKKDLIRFEITGEHDEQHLREIREARNFFYFLIWRE